MGLSFLDAANRIKSLTTVNSSYSYNGQTVPYSYQITQTSTDRIWSVSPLVRVGVVLFPQSLFSLRLDAVYVSYANTAKGLGQTFDLGLSGLMVEELLQIRL